MATTSSSLPHALHADIIVVDEPGRALLRRTDAVHRREELCFDTRTGRCYHYLPDGAQRHPRRYVWKAKGEDIFRKIDAARRALNTQHNSISETPHSRVNVTARATV